MRIEIRCDGPCAISIIDYGPVRGREYRAGTGDISDILGVQSRVLAAQVDLAIGEFERDYAGLVLLATMGGLGEREDGALLALAD